MPQAGSIKPAAADRCIMARDMAWAFVVSRAITGHLAADRSVFFRLLLAHSPAPTSAQNSGALPRRRSSKNRCGAAHSFALRPSGYSNAEATRHENAFDHTTGSCALACEKRLSQCYRNSMAWRACDQRQGHDHCHTGAAFHRAQPMGPRPRPLVRVVDPRCPQQTLACGRHRLLPRLS